MYLLFSKLIHTPIYISFLRILKERLKSNENARDRSPLGHSVSGIWNAATSTTGSNLTSTSASSLGKKGLIAGKPKSFCLFYSC